MSRLLVIAALLAALMLAACGDDDEDSSSMGDEPAAVAESDAEPAEGGQPEAKSGAGDSKEEAPPGTEVVLADSQYGSILFGPQQRAIYLFDKERSPTSECYGDCATAWPPVLTKGDPVAGEGVDEKLLATTERDDGSIQVTYAGHPLYYYVDDPPGEVLCHNVEEFGGLWLVVEASGEPVA